jgi:SAM-dependent methyltransferase
VTDAASLWGGASYERIAETFAPIHDRVAAVLGPAAGVRALDLACGTGALTLRLARLGAETTGLDISPGQLAKAREAAAQAGLAIRFDQGDAEALPYADGEFDAVGSAFGIIFAPDAPQAAAELTRVTKPGGRIAVTTWTSDDWSSFNTELGRDPVQGEYVWDDRERVANWLGDFDLEYGEGEWNVRKDSPAAMWEFLSGSMPPLKAWLDEQTAERTEEVRRRFEEFFGEEPVLRRRYVLITGRRR